jgi:CRISPR system Cascade subunit CasD
MNTLLLRLAGPMQAWGTQSRFTHRDTGLEPSKSGVVGLLCAALGRPRTADIADLAALRMGVRVDREGVVRRDYQTAGGSHRRGEVYGVVKAEGGLGGTVVSSRHYLADADFLVGLASDDLDLLVRLDEAVGRPHWPIYLGRKAFVPGAPVRLPEGGVRPGVDVRPALTDEPWPSDGPLRFVLEAGMDPDVDDRIVQAVGERRLDQPLADSFSSRRFLPRAVLTMSLERPSSVQLRKG